MKRSSPALRFDFGRIYAGSLVNKIVTEQNPRNCRGTVRSRNPTKLYRLSELFLC